MGLRARQRSVIARASTTSGAEPSAATAARRERRKIRQQALARMDAEHRLQPRMALAGATADVFFKERFIGDVDLLPVSFLDRGAAVAHSVCRLALKDEIDRLDGYATGVLVGENLLLTNNHVLPSKDEARRARAELDYADDARNTPLAMHAFELEPERFFCTDVELDYTLVAIRPTALDGTPIERFGVSRLISTCGKALVYEHLNIVQHPNGQAKQIAIRHNDLESDASPDFLEYESDTTVGSSGSPVYNDAWVIVALHSCGVARRDEKGRYFDKHSGRVIEGEPDSLEDVEFRANRGVRISSIYAHLQRRSDLSPADGRLALSIFHRLDEAPVAAVIGPSPAAAKSGDGAAAPASLAAAPVAAAVATPAVAIAVERLTLDRYAGCQGFDESFLGVPVALPRLSPALLADAAPVAGAEDRVLRYTHFSVMMSASRKLAFFVACNIDGSRCRRVRRSAAGVLYSDGRIAAEQQTSEQIYARNRMGRAHLVSREAPAWGDEAEQADRDTNHFTSCAPLFEAFNQQTWLELEDGILDGLRDQGRRADVFGGPIFGEQDLEYRGVKIPEQLWKIVATNEGGRLRAAAYIESQRELSSDVGLAFGACKVYRVPVARVEALTGLDFGPVRDADTFGEGEGPTTRDRTGAPFRELIDVSGEVL